MMETVTAIHISDTNYTVEIVDYHDKTFVLQIFGATGAFKAAAVIDAEECQKIAIALFAAAGVQPVITTRGITSADFKTEGGSAAGCGGIPPNKTGLNNRHT